MKEGSAKKGDVLGVARVAGIMATKRTSDLIPLCHVLALTKCAVDFTLDDESHSITARCTVQCEGKTGVEMEALTGVSTALLTVYDMCKAMDKRLDDESHSITARCTVQCEGKTGVEMEALTGVSTALLTVYDMCKAMDKRMVISDIHLCEKQGGKSGDFVF